MCCHIAPISCRGPGPTGPQHSDIRKQHAFQEDREQQAAKDRPAAETHRVEGSQPEAPAVQGRTPVST